MKLLFALTMLVASLSFAFTDHGTFHGKGVWKSPDLSSGTWTESLTVAKVENEIQMTSHVKVFHQEELIQEKTVITKLVPTENGFFNVMVGDRTTGHGYCFRSLCHFDMAAEGEQVEETIHMEKNVMRKMGSGRGTRDGEKYYVSWIGELRHR